jgi:hypothetical protein
MLFCSTESTEGTDRVYQEGRVDNQVVLPFGYERKIFLNFDTRHFITTTGKYEQTQRTTISIIGQLRQLEDDKVLIHPLIMGSPVMPHPLTADVSLDYISRHRLWPFYSGYEITIEDIDEFAQCENVSVESNEWISYMKHTPEEKIKGKLAEILGDTTRKDWAGEQYDHSSYVHISGKRFFTAFLLKGPARFREMTPDMLGKRADQIYRLSQASAKLLVVQHCHTIGEAVRATLRVFAVAPHNPRWYCLIDGKDTYRILKAYDKL